MNIGIFSGTFDPVHSGHMAFCAAAMEQCGLQKLYVLPEQTPRGKTGVSDLPRRVAWLEAAAVEFEQIEIMTLAEKQFTVHGTLPQLEVLFPGATLTLLVGSDVAKTLPHRWPDVELLFRRVNLAIGLRGDDTKAEIIDAMERFATPPRYNIITTAEAHQSSSRLRSKELNK